ncbi:hypothetical protein KR50_18400 [Jeotgalibacillus campisalis]|uniref:Uncharacterized protein n=1 Tax=Jeotgalibacillus campisalis TaxID=220754 RepID=A0A0C2VUI8_9BACL|nr:hypothetical protein KR50_18400 [Jeotgalibacillus campisalis]
MLYVYNFYYVNKKSLGQMCVSSSLIGSLRFRRTLSTGTAA